MFEEKGNGLGVFQYLLRLGYMHSSVQVWMPVELDSQQTGKLPVHKGCSPGQQLDKSESRARTGQHNNLKIPRKADRPGFTISDPRPGPGVSWLT